MVSAIKLELQAIIEEYTVFQSKQKSKGTDVGYEIELNQLNVRCIAAVERGAGRNSIYYRQVIGEPIMHPNTIYNLMGRIGIVQALLHDIEHGYFRSFEDIIHSEVFGDYLEMSSHLLENGYISAAAVIAGSTLEVHLRQLCKKNQIETVQNERPLKADRMNAELAKASVFSLGDQKSVTAWLDIRNNAAHGNYEACNKSQVELLIQSIRDFITRNPA